MLKYFFLILTIALQSWSAHPDKIIGENDFVMVNADATNIPLKYKDLVDAVGLLKSGCTVTHIGFGYALTAGHCFWAPAVGKMHLPCDEGETIAWGLREGVEPYLISRCDEIIMAQHNADYDFAVIKVSPAPKAMVGVDLDRQPIVNDPLTLFSHPDGETLRWSGVCKVEEPEHPDFSKLALHHQCDTIRISSGAALISELNLKVVAIHDGGADPEPERVDPSPLPIFKTGSNYGTFILGTPLENILRELGFK